MSTIHDLFNTSNGNSIISNIQSTFRSPQLANTHLYQQVILVSWGCLFSQAPGYWPFWKSLAVFPLPFPTMFPITLQLDPHLCCAIQ